MIPILAKRRRDELYDLRDEFSQTLAAGSVNGTVGESGAVRTVVDTYAATELCTNGGFETVGAGPSFHAPAAIESASWSTAAAL